MKNTKRILSLTLAICVLLVSAACGGTAAEPDQTTQSPAGVPPSPQTAAPDPPSPSPSPDEQVSHYPVEIITYNFEGEEIVTVYEKAPERVLAVYQGSIETMIVLGLEDYVLASYGLDNEVKPEWRAGLARMNYDDSVFAPDRETVVMLDPDMIFSWGSYFGENRLGDVDYWINSGTNTYINTNTRRGGHPRTVENEMTDLLNIGRIFNVEDKAQALVDEMQREIDAALEAARGRAPKTVAIIEFLSGNISNYTGTQLGGNMVERLGGVLAIPDITGVGYEDLLEADPDIIFVVYMELDAAYEEGGADEAMGLIDTPALASLSAMQNGRIHLIMLGDMYASTVRTIDGIRTFSAGMYPS